MSVLIVGLSHNSAPLDVLERATQHVGGPEQLAEIVHAGEHVEEAMVLSTCNRLEVVVEAGTFHGALTEIGELLGQVTGLNREELSDYLYVHYDERAVSHLFSLACGLDSMAVGESQILGQLREALAQGQRSGRLGPALNPLLQQALRVGKRAHSETSIDEVSRSLVQLGLEQAGTVLADLPSARAVVIGAGAMSGLSVATLLRAGLRDVVVVNRTRERAERLADNHDVRIGEWSELAALVGGADLVLTCTGAGGHVIDSELLARSRTAAGRTGAPQVFLDLAMPRDVDPEVTRLAGVHLWGLAELQRQEWAEAGGEDFAITGQAPQNEAVAAVEELVTSEVASYLTELRAARLGPTLAALRNQATKVVDAEMARLDGKLPHLPAEERDEVRKTVQRVVDKLLHTPTVRVKQLTGRNERADYGQALRALFDLDPNEVAVVATPPLDTLDLMSTQEAAS